MDAERRDELERVMAGLAAGDVAMVVALATAFGDELRRTLVALAGSAGLPRPPAADLDGLVFCAAEELGRIAGAWDPRGGALPWVWGRHRLLNLLRADAAPFVLLLGDVAAPEAGVSPTPPPAPWSAEEPDALAVLAGAARRRPDAALVHDALVLALSPADREVLLLHAQQVADGDPAPAATVAREVRRSPDAVRQVVHRSRRRLARLALDDARFEPILRLPLLGPAARPEAA